MTFLLYTLAMILIALAVGGLAQLVLPGRDELGWLGTFFLGLTGSFIGGLLAWAIFGERRGVGLLGSVLVAVLMLYTVRKLNGGGLRDPGQH